MSARPTLSLSSEPPSNCSLCPRLSEFLRQARSCEPSWHNAPVPSFGDPDPRVLIVGLAPGLQGANRTGRPFTGDHAGMLLYGTLLALGFATGRYDARTDDGLTLRDCRITNAVRCERSSGGPSSDGEDSSRFGGRLFFSVIKPRLSPRFRRFHPRSRESCSTQDDKSPPITRGARRRAARFALPVRSIARRSCA